jgi:hypothetical protein
MIAAILTLRAKGDAGAERRIIGRSFDLDLK